MKKRPCPGGCFFIQPEPAKVLYQLELELPARALRIRVVDPKDKPAPPPRRAGEQKIEERCPGPSDVKLPRRRGGEARPDHPLRLSGRFIRRLLKM